MFFKQVILVLVVINASFESNVTSKRGVFEIGYGQTPTLNGYEAFPANEFGPVVLPSPPVYKPYVPIKSPSPAEIAAAIQAAKEASATVMAAQQRVQVAKTDVLHQQHVASQRQAQATLAQQKAEAAAAVQQQEAKSAAQALVHAQQRLAQAKAEVAQYQKIAAAKEAHAAAIIQKSAAAAQAEIHRTDEAAKKISALQHSGAVTLKQVAASKDGTLSATSAAVAASNNAHNEFADNNHQDGPWFPTDKFVHIQPWG